MQAKLNQGVAGVLDIQRIVTLGIIAMIKSTAEIVNMVDTTFLDEAFLLSETVFLLVLK